MIVELGIPPQATMKRTRQSRATLLESAMKLPIRGTSLCRISHFSIKPRFAALLLRISTVRLQLDA
jgi:hypothetical protein